MTSEFRPRSGRAGDVPSAVRWGSAAAIASGLIGLLFGCSPPPNDSQSRVAQRPSVAVDDASCSVGAATCSGDDGGTPTLDATPGNGSDTTPGTGTDATTAALDGADGSLDFTSCTTDSDCIAVPEVGCCGPGAWVAVNRSRVDAYQATTTCTELQPMCPTIAVVGDRVPECDNGTFHCTMIVASSIACGGFIRNQHHCPDGYACSRRGRVPDIPGTCVAVDGGAD